MDFSSLLYSLGLSGFFSSRAFLPAFITAFALKYGDQLPFLKGLDFIQSLGEAPAWLTHPVVVWGLGALALCELLADKSPELRELMDEGMVYAKTGASAAVSFGIFSDADVKAVEDIVSMAGFFDTIPAALSGGLTYFLSRIRLGAVSILSEADEDDTLGVRGFISWCEELWASFGVWILFGAPLLMSLLVGAAFGSLWLARKRHEAKMEAAKVACPKCGARIHPFATACFSCGERRERPNRLSFLAKTLEEVEPDPTAQKVRLLELKRSPLSGEAVKGRGVDLSCEEDGTKLFGDPDLTRRYLETVDSRLVKVMLVVAAFGLVPILGLVIGVVYYRFQLVAPFRRYLPLSRGIVVKWLIRLVFLVLALFQLVPVLGAVSVPIMAWLNHRFYRGAFRSELGKKGLLPS